VIKQSYVQGTPNWVDLSTSDVDGAQAFYGELMGWQFESNPTGQGGEYVMASKGQHSAAGMMEQFPAQAEAGIPPHWSTYIAVDDVAATVARAEAAGGSVVMPPMQVMESGEMAVLTDPSGAAFGIWKANQHIGCEVVNEDCAVMWNELISDDMAAAAPFYAETFGVEITTQDMGGPEPYTLFNIDGAPVGGGMAPPVQGAPNHWATYFGVADCDAAAAKAAELGGTIVAEPFEIPGVGKMAGVTDPQGAFFMMMQPEQPSEA